MRGKLVIVVMLTVALAAGGFAWWWNLQRSVRTRELWGPWAASIRSAKEVEAIELAEGDLALPGRDAPQLRAVDVATAPGFLNARTSLLVDESFDWSAPTETPARWTHAVRFNHQEMPATVLFDFEHKQIALLESGRRVRLLPKTASGWQGYLHRMLKNQTPSTQER